MRRARTEEGVGDIQQDASDITLDLRVEAHLALFLRLLQHSITCDSSTKVLGVDEACKVLPFRQGHTAVTSHATCA